MPYMPTQLYVSTKLLKHLPAKWKVLRVICVEGSPTLTIKKSRYKTQWIWRRLTLEMLVDQLLPQDPPDYAYT